MKQFKSKGLTVETARRRRGLDRNVVVPGIDPRLQLQDPSGRAISVLDDPTPISELL